jgi:hypothetical protein
MPKNQKKIATSIIKRRHRARQLTKLAVGSFNSMPGSIPGWSEPTQAALSSPPSPQQAAANNKTFNDSVANAGRVSSGILGSLAGGLGTLATGAVSHANSLWNAVSHPSLNTSPEYTRDVNNTFQKVLDWTNASQADVYQGLGGSATGKDSWLPDAFKKQTGWGESQRAQQQQANLASMPEGVLKDVAETSEDVGDAAWNWAQVAGGVNAARAGLSAIPGAARAGAVLSQVAPRARAAVTTVTGLPLSQAANPYAMLAAIGGQSLATNLAEGVDARNAATGNPTNYSAATDLLPSNLAQRALSDAVGPDAAGLVYRAGFGAAMPNQLGSAVPLLAGDAVNATLNNIGPNAEAEPPAEVGPQLETAQPEPQPEPQVAQTQQPGRRPFDITDDEVSETQPLSTAQEPQSGRRPFDITEDEATEAPSASASPENQTPPNNIPGLAPDASPEVVQQAQETQAALKENPDTAPALKDPKFADQVRQDKGRPIHDKERAAAYTQQTPPPPNGKPQEWGEWFQGLMTDLNNSWSSMDPMAQLAIGLGVPIGLIGMFSGGIGGFLLGAIGLGVGGMAAAQSGMFGDEAKGYADAGMNTVMQATGLDQMFGQPAADAQTQPANTAAGAKVTVPANTPPAAAQQSFEYTPDSARKVLTDISAAWPTSLRSTVKNNETALLEIAKQNDDELAGVVGSLNPKTRTDLVTNLNRIYNHVTDDPNTPMNEPEVVKPQAQRLLRLLESQSMKKSSVNYVEETLMPKIARCWKGYEPVPGTKAYTEGSCRPKGSKKTQKQMKKKSSWSAVDIVNNYINSPQINSRQPWQTGLSAKH